MAIVVTLSVLCLIAGYLVQAAAGQTLSPTTKQISLTTRSSTVTTKPMTVSSTTSKSTTKLISTSQVSTSTSKSSAVTSQSTAPRSTATSSQSTQPTSIWSTASGSMKCNLTRLIISTNSIITRFSNLFSQPWTSDLLSSSCSVLGSVEDYVKSIPGCTDTAPETSSWRAVTAGYDYICGQGQLEFLNGTQLCFPTIDKDSTAKSCITNTNNLTCVMARAGFSCIQKKISLMPNCDNTSGRVYATYFWYTQIQPNLTNSDSSCNVLVPPPPTLSPSLPPSLPPTDAASNSDSSHPPNVVPVAVGVGVGIGVPVLIGIIVGIVLCVKLKCCPVCCDPSTKTVAAKNNTPKSTMTKKTRNSNKDKGEPQTQLAAEKDGVSWYSTNRLSPHEMIAISKDNKDHDEPDLPEPLGDDDDFMAHF